MESLLSPQQRFWKLLKPDKAEIKNIYVYAIFNGLVNLSLPLGIQAIVNLIQGGQVNTSWIVLIAIVVLGVAVSGILQIYQLRIVENLQQRIFARAAFEFTYRVPRIRMEELYRHYAPELMNRFFDTISVQKGLSKMLLDFSAAALQVIFGLILLSFYHPFFILFSVLLVILIYVIFKLTVAKGLKTSITESKYKYKVAHWLEEVARTLQVFRLAGNPDLPIERTDANVKHYLDARESHFKVLVQQYSFMVAFKVVVALGLLAIGGILVMEQLMNIGQFVAAEIIILLIMNSVEKLILNLEVIYDVLTSLEKIGQVSDLNLEGDEGIDIETHCDDAGLSFRIENVDFAYPESKVPRLFNLSFEAKPGEKVLFIGPSGAGKSTLLHIIAGLFEIQKGNISYNGYSIGEVSLSSLRKTIGDCLGSQEIFDGTLWENISLGRPDVSREDVQEVIDALGLIEFVRKLPFGVNTQLDPLGSKLPNNVVQRLLLARAIVDKPKMLLIENGLKDFPFNQRKEILDYLFDKKHRWTILAVGYDEYFAEHADRVVYMKGGAVAEEGGLELFERVSSANQDDHA